MSHFADLNVTIPSELADEFLSKLYYVSESLAGFELTQERDRVRFQLPPQADQQATIIAARIAEVAQKMCSAYRPAEGKLLASRPVSGSFDQDPHPLLEARVDLIPFGPGRFGFGPRLYELIEFFDRQLFQRAKQFKAIPCQFPTLIGADVMLRLKYLKSFPHSLTFVSHLREDLVAIQDFARTAHWDGKHLASDLPAIDGIQCLLSPNVCFHCYAWLHDSCQPKARAYTAAGKSFRYESGNLQGLERLWDFTMREWIFVGPQAYVLEQRERATEETIKLLNEWQLGYEIRSATDAVFVDEYARAAFQLAFDLKYEIQVSLPYKANTLAAGSLNFHRDFFGRCMNITTADGEPANMGCAAFGLERLALAFLAQHGLDAGRWPAAVANNLKSW
jgi:hypothetical protein